MACQGCGNETVLYLPDGTSREPTEADMIAQSYRLCLSFDDFLDNKAIWIVDLSNGVKVFQDDERPGVHTPSAWKRLGYYIKDYPDVRITKMRLRFGTNIVELPPNRQYYFYSRGLLQAVTQTHGLNFHICGWPAKDDEEDSLVCTWFKSPELAVADQQARPLNKCTNEQLIGLTLATFVP